MGNRLVVTILLLNLRNTFSIPCGPSDHCVEPLTCNTDGECAKLIIKQNVLWGVCGVDMMDGAADVVCACDMSCVDGSCMWTVVEEQVPEPDPLSTVDKIRNILHL
jgi:hypothetical protein